MLNNRSFLAASILSSRGVHLGGLLVFLILVGCSKPEPAPRVNVDLTDASDNVQHVKATDGESNDRSKTTPSARHPKLEVDVSEHDFGEMNPHQFGEYRFVVRNVGEAPLELHSERSTCNCTIVELPTAPLAPGEETSIVCKWETERNNERFLESATIRTNDPDHPRLKLTITGDVLVHVGANPPELLMPQVHPGQATSVTTVVTSQVWDSFGIEDISSSLEGFEATVHPATPEQLDALNAKAGHQLTINIPDTLPQGEFNHWVRFQIRPPAEESDDGPKSYELPLRGKVLRRVAVYGPGIDFRGRISMGVIPTQKGLHRRMVMKVRDPDPELRVREISHHPSFLDVKVTPYEGKAGTAKGLYHLDIQVPKASPVGRYQASEAGEIKIEFDHPRIPSLDLRVDFAVSNHGKNLQTNQPLPNNVAHGVITRRKNR